MSLFRRKGEPEPAPQPWFPERFTVTSAPPGVEPLGYEFDMRRGWVDRRQEASERLRVQHSESEAAARAAQRHSGDYLRRPPDEDLYLTGTGWHSAREEAREADRCRRVQAEAQARRDQRHSGDFGRRPPDYDHAANLPR